MADELASKFVLRPTGDPSRHRPACMAHHDRAVPGVKARRVECDAFNYCKRAALKTAKAAPAGAGDVWTLTATDADSKLLE